MPSIFLIVRLQREKHEQSTGYPERVWALAKEEAKVVLTAVARTRDVIPYSDLSSAYQFDLVPGYRPAVLLHSSRGLGGGVPSRPRNAYSRGRSQERRLQNRAWFFELARGLGLDATDTDGLWVEQSRRSTTIGAHNHRSGDRRSWLQRSSTEPRSAANRGLAVLPPRLLTAGVSWQ